MGLAQDPPGQLLGNLVRDRQPRGLVLGSHCRSRFGLPGLRDGRRAGRRLGRRFGKRIAHGRCAGCSLGWRNRRFALREAYDRMFLQVLKQFRVGLRRRRPRDVEGGNRLAAGGRDQREQMLVGDRGGNAPDPRAAAEQRVAAVLMRSEQRFLRGFARELAIFRRRPGHGVGAVDLHDQDGVLQSVRTLLGTQPPSRCISRVSARDQHEVRFPLSGEPGLENVRDVRRATLDSWDGSTVRPGPSARADLPQVPQQGDTPSSDRRQTWNDSG